MCSVRAAYVLIGPFASPTHAAYAKRTQHCSPLNFVLNLTYERQFAHTPSIRQNHSLEHSSPSNKQVLLQDLPRGSNSKYEAPQTVLAPEGCLLCSECIARVAAPDAGQRLEPMAWNLWLGTYGLGPRQLV